MISVTDALGLIASHRANYGTCEISLSEALGATCAVPVKARLTMPPFDASAMDGYAVKLSDAKAGARLTVIGEAPAGSPFSGSVRDGKTVRIFTGGPVPDGANTILIQENVTREASHIIVNVGMDTPRHIRRAGIDFSRGDTLISKDHVIGPADITLAASGNYSHLTAYRRPKVAIIANGDELLPPGSNLETGQIISSNSPGLAAFVRHWGGETVDMGIAADNLDSITTKIKNASEADIIVPVGGASVGDYDLMKQAFGDLGFEHVFSKIAVRPGKPTWFGTLGKQRVLGLPGNPASAAVCAHLFLRPLITDSLSPVSATLDTDISANGARETYLRGRLYIDAGRLTAQPFPRQDSSLITPLARSNALIKLPPSSGPWSAGDRINVLPLGMGPNIL